MDTSRDIGERLERCFDDIGRTRMAGVPILNQALRVKVIGLRPWRDHWLCTLLTPWFLNLMLLPRGDEDDTLPVGGKRVFTFPAGQFEFIRGREPAVGAYWMCSLFSPVLEFADQDSAEATAAAALDEILKEGAEEETRTAAVSRRDLLRGRATAEERRP